MRALNVHLKPLIAFNSIYYQNIIHSNTHTYLHRTFSPSFFFFLFSFNRLHCVGCRKFSTLKENCIFAPSSRPSHHSLQLSITHAHIHTVMLLCTTNITTLHGICCPLTTISMLAWHVCTYCFKFAQKHQAQSHHSLFTCVCVCVAVILFIQFYYYFNAYFRYTTTLHAQSLIYSTLQLAHIGRMYLQLYIEQIGEYLRETRMCFSPSFIAVVVVVLVVDVVVFITGVTGFFRFHITKSSISIQNWCSAHRFTCYSGIVMLTLSM